MRLPKWAYTLFSQQEAEGDDLYDEVDESTYKTIVRGRLQQDDFIEDDDGGGYADNGMEIYDEEDGHCIEEEDSDCDQRSEFNPFHIYLGLVSLCSRGF